MIKALSIATLACALWTGAAGRLKAGCGPSGCGYVEVVDVFGEAYLNYDETEQETGFIHINGAVPPGLHVGGSYRVDVEKPGIKVPRGVPFHVRVSPGNDWEEVPGQDWFRLGLACGVTTVEVNGIKFEASPEIYNSEEKLFIKYHEFPNGSAVEYWSDGCGCNLDFIKSTMWTDGANFVVKIPSPDSCNGSGDTAPSPSGSGFSVEIPSGSDSGGTSAGNIGWSGERPSLVVDPANWWYHGADLGLAGVSDVSVGNIRQIRTSTMLTEMVAGAGNLVVRQFASENIGPQLPSGLYDQTGETPVRTTTYASSETLDPQTLELLQANLQVSTLESQEVTVWHEVDYDKVLGKRSVTDHLAGTREVATTANPSAGARIETEESYRFSKSEGSYVLIARVRTTYEDDRVVETMVDPGGADIGTEYFHDPITGEQVATRRTDGSWTSRSRIRYETVNGNTVAYLAAADGLPDPNSWSGAGGEVISVDYRPWLDSALPASNVPLASECAADLEIELFGGGVRRRETRIMGTVTRRIDTWTEEALQEPGGGPLCRVDFTRSWNSGAAGDYLDGSTWTHAAGTWKGRTYKIVEEDGSVRRFDYAYENYPEGQSYVECLRTTEWQEGSGLRSVSIADGDGRVREEREEIDTGGGNWEAMAADTYSYEIDSAGRLQSKSRYKNGILVGTTTYESQTSALDMNMGSPAIRTVRDREGNIVTVTEDYPSAPDVVTIYKKDGRTETVIRSAGNLSETSVTVSDVAGRTVSSTDARGIVTTTAYDVANRTVTVTRPGGVTEITQTYVDGRQKSHSGTGVISSFTAYAVDGNGFISSTEHTGSSDNSSPRTVTTVADWSDRTRSISRPSPAGSGTVAQTYHYDAATGRLMRISNNAGIAAQVYAYDSLGRVALSGLDLNGDGLATVLSGDRLTERTVTYDKGFGLWWEATTTKQYYKNNSDSAYTRVERRRMKPDLVGGAARWTSVVIEPDGPEVTTHRDETFADGTVTETVDSNATTVSPDSRTVMIAGRLQSSSEYGSSPGSSYSYDALGRMIAMTDARGGTTRTFYNGLGQVEKTTDHAQNPATYEYYPSNHASAGLVKKITNGEQQTTEYTYNSLGRVQTVGGSGSYPQAYGYSAYGELNTLTTYPAGGSGETTTWVHDPATGVLKEKIYPGGKKTTYAYHAHGQASRRTWARTAGGAVFSDYAYTLAGDLEGIDYSDATPDVSIVPDRLGRPTTVTDGGGEQTIAYEVAGEADVTYSATHAALPGVTLDRTWDHAIGRRTVSGVYRGGTWDQKSVYGYDAASGRLGSVTGGSNGSAVHEYSYDPGTNVIKGIEHRVNSSLEAEQKRRIDPAGRLYGMETLNGSGTVRQRHGYKYDKAGRRTKLTREDGAWWDYGYNDRGEVTSGKKKLPGGTPLAGHQFEYAYDAIGNRDWAKSGGDANGQNLRTTNYTANGLNQYTQITTPGKFDILGRSPAATVTVNGTAALRQGERFHSEVTAINVGSAVWKAVTVDDGTSPAVTGNYYLPKLSVQPQYDDDGNLTADGRWLYEWDAENRLVVMKTDTATQQSGQPYVRLVFSYDWMGRRVRKQVFDTPTGTTPVEDRRFAYDGWNLVAEYTASGSTLTLQRSYVWGLDLSGTEQGAGGIGGLLSTHHANGNLAALPAYDGNGNIAGWLDSSGAMLSQMEYDPFGNRIMSEGSLESSFGFSTKYQDKETGLYYYGYRYYQPEHGRWPSRDPIEEQGGLNLYGFIGNNGLSGNDLLGLLHIDEINGGTLQYSERCGWIDWRHVDMLFEMSIRIFRDVVDDRGLVSGGKRRRFWVNLPGGYDLWSFGVQVQKSSADNEILREGIVHGIVKQASFQIEVAQAQGSLHPGAAESAWSGEDLMSNFLGFYLRHRGPFRNLCKVETDTEVNRCIFRKMGDKMPRNTEWLKPLDFNEEYQDVLNEVIKDQSRTIQQPLSIPGEFRTLLLIEPSPWYKESWIGITFDGHWALDTSGRFSR